MKKTFLLIHRWLGLSLGLLLALLGLSGSLLVFRPELDALVNPQLLSAQPQAQKASIQAQWETVQAKFPEHEASLMFAGKSPQNTNEWWLDEGKLRAYTNPYTGEFLGSRTDKDSFFLFLYSFHTKLFAGENGEKVVGWSGVVLLALSLSGIVLWFPRHWTLRKAFVPHLKTNAAGKIYESHRVGGFYLAFFLVSSSLTGMSLVWPETAQSVLAFAGTDPKPKKVKASEGKWKTLDELVQSGQGAFPEAQFIRITFPAKEGAPLGLRFKWNDELHPNGMNNVVLDPVSGKILQKFNSREVAGQTRLMNLRFPLHTGHWSGSLEFISRLTQVFVGLSPTLLGISGFLMWRRRNKRAARAKKTTPKITS